MEIAVRHLVEQEEGMGAGHVLVFPFPLLGHISPMLKLAELLSLAGLHVTFIHTHHSHRFPARLSAPYARLAGSPRFRFRSIPDGIDDHDRSSPSAPALAAFLRTDATASFREILLELVGGDGAARGWPPLTCVIVDGIMSFALDVAGEFRVATMIFRCSSACNIWCNFCFPKLIQTGDLPFPDDADLDELARIVPGMEGFLRRRDLPLCCRHYKDTVHPSFELLSAAAANTPRARAVILNTFESLEPSALSHIRSYCPNTYAIGPLHALLDARHGEVGRGCGGGTTSASLPEEDRSCMDWLDAQPDRSVVYVSFGSLAVLSPEDFREFQHGLLSSGQRFLWVVRPDLVKNQEGVDRGAELPPPAAAPEGRGLLMEWAPQKEVLRHRAVGCFLTHSGWNSTVEGIVAGVPMICWPHFAEQHINSRFVGEVWRVGIDMKDVHDRGTVEEMVREAMEGEGAEELRRSAAELAAEARRSVAAGGTSAVAFDKLTQEIKSLRSDMTRQTD